MEYRQRDAKDDDVQYNHYDGHLNNDLPPLLRLLSLTTFPRSLSMHVVNLDDPFCLLEEKENESLRIRRRHGRQEQTLLNDGEEHGRRRRGRGGPSSPSRPSRSLGVVECSFLFFFFLVAANEPCHGFHHHFVPIVPSFQHRAAIRQRHDVTTTTTTKNGIIMIHRTMLLRRQRHQRLLSNVNNDDDNDNDDKGPLSTSLLNDDNMGDVSVDDEDEDVEEEKEETDTIVNNDLQLSSGLYSGGGAGGGGDGGGDNGKKQQRYHQHQHQRQPTPSATTLFSKIRHNPVLAEALLMDLLQRQQQQWEQRRQQSDGDSEDDESTTATTTPTTETTTTTIQLERMTADHFNVVMDMYVHDRSRKDGPEQALRVFYTLLDLYYEYRDDDNPSSVGVYKSSSSDDDDDDEDAATANTNGGTDKLKLDDDDDDDDDDPMKHLCPNFRSYEILVYGFKNQGNSEKAKEVVQLMMKDSLGYYDDHPLSNETVTESGWKNRGVTALDFMTRHNRTTTAFSNSMYNPHNRIPFPVKSFYNVVLRSYVDQSSPSYDLDDPDSPANRADGFLLWLEDQHDKYRPYMPFRSKLNSYSYALVMRAWVAQACAFYDDGTIVPVDGRQKGDRGGGSPKGGQTTMHRSPSRVNDNRNRGNNYRGRTGYRDFDGQHIRVEALIRALQLLKRMKAMYERDGRRESLAGIPDPHTYYSLLRPFCRMGQGRRAEQLLDLCIQTRLRVQELRDEKLALSLSAAAAAANAEDDDDCEDIDDTIDEPTRVTKNKEVPLRVAEPTTKMFVMVMDAWSHSYDDAEAPERVENLLRRMIEYHDSGQLPLVEAPNTVIYNTVIHAWSRSKNPEAPYRALEILKTMKARSQESGENIRPDVITYSGVMNAFGRRGSVQETVEVFEMMFHDFSVDGNTDAQPDDVAISTLINALVRKQDQLLLKKKKERGRLNEKDKAEEGWCSPKQVETILKRMEDMYSQGVLRQRPSQCYGDLSTLYARSDLSDGPSRAREILTQMQMLYETGENPAAKPNDIHFNRILDAFARSGDLSNAELVLEDMIRLAETGKNPLVRPTRISYTTLINAHKRVKGEKIDPERAERILRMMEERSQSGDDKNDRNLRPDFICYTSLIDCYAKAAIGCHDDVDESRRYLRRAEELLDEMIALSNAGVRKVGPVELTFNTLLKGFAFSKGLDQKEDRIEDRVGRLLDLMNEHKVRPNKYTHYFIRCAKGNKGSSHGVGAGKGTRRTTTTPSSSRSYATRPSRSDRSPSFRTAASTTTKNKKPGTPRTRFRK